jgi:hypothetical protein
MKQLDNFDEVIARLGGVAKVARLTNRRTQAIWNWRSRQFIPARAFFLIETPLRRRGYTAARSLFRFEEPRRKDAA